MKLTPSPDTILELSLFKHLSVKHNRVMVLPIERDYTKSDGGIVMQSQQEPVTFKEGAVVAMGDGAYLQDGQLLPIPVNLGDLVYFNDMHGTDYKALMEDGTYCDVKIVDVPSIQFVDGLANGRDYIVKQTIKRSDYT